MPQFHIYPDVPQNLMRPTWKGTRGLGFVPNVFGTTESTLIYGAAGAALLLGGIGLGFWLGRRKR